MSDLRIAETISINTKNGDINIDGVDLPFHTIEEGPQIALIEAGLKLVTLTFFADNVHLLGRGSKPIEIADKRYEQPSPAKCACQVPEILNGWGDTMRAARGAWHGCPIHDPIAYLRDLGAREKAAALAHLAQRVDAIYEDLGLTRETL